MITAQDTDFHPRDPADLSWTETTFIPFCVPEEGIFGNAYVLARPNLGICTSSIIVSKGICNHTYQIDFTDAQVHLPCPEKFSDYSLPNGLTVKSSNAPRDYHFTYEHKMGSCSFDLNFKAIHHPFDPHDPNENPLLEKTKAAPKDSRVGHEWSNGHFECKGHITGELMLRGQKFKVDCYDGMDHSWGPRVEYGARSVSWISVNFGEELAVHLAVPMKIVKGEVLYDKPQFGFVVQNGETFGVVDATVVATRVDMMATGNHITVTDIRGKSFEFYGATIGGHPWHSFNPCHVCYQVAMRYTWNGKVGSGEFGDIFGLEYLADHKSRTATFSR
ncbi:MAG: hypothetical protein AB7O39_14545 [Flavobacteriaceae bacterium]